MNIQEIMDWCKSQFSENQFLVGALGSGILWTVLTYLRTVYSWGVSFFNFLFKRDIICRENEKFYINFMKFIGSKVNNPRSLRMVKQGDKLVSILGKGRHRFFFMRSFFSVYVYEEVKAGSEKPIEYTTISVWSFFVDKKIKKIQGSISDFTPTNIQPKKLVFSPAYVQFEEIKCKSRSFDTIFVPSNIKLNLIKLLDNFKVSEMYEKLGINRKMGIILYGPPGTGKSSLANAIASYLEYDTYYIPQDPKAAKSAIESIKAYDGKKAIIIDDIDCLSKTMTNRKANAELNLGFVLDFLDNLGGEDSVIIATTNNYEDLDPALRRSGRFDVKAYIGPADREIAKEMIEAVDPNRIDLLDSFEYPVPQSDIQARLISNGEIVL